MIRKRLSFSAIPVFSLLFIASQSSAQELIANGSFDSNLDGWASSPDSTGIISWTGSQGQPPGAMKFIGEDQEALLLDCFHLVPGTITFSSDAFMETSGEFVSCHLNFFLYTEATDCTGPFGVFTIIGEDTVIPEVENPNEWERLVLEVQVPNNPAETGVLSFRPIMVKFGDFMGDDACIFDNASLRIVPRGVTEVPALSPAGFAVFGALLSLVALVALRKARG